MLIKTYGSHILIDIKIAFDVWTALHVQTRPYLPGNVD